MPDTANTFGMTFRFRAQDGDAPVLGVLGRKDRRRHNGWREREGAAGSGESQRLMIVKKRLLPAPSAPSPSSLRYTE